MSEVHTMMLSLTIYKIVTILIGFGFAFMGYRLFIHGIFKSAGELSTNWENRRLVLKKAAPGTFFALFGVIIICVSLWRGLTFGGPGYSISSNTRIDTGSAIGETSNVHTSDRDSGFIPGQKAPEHERLRVREHIGFLNQSVRLFNPDLEEAKQQRIQDRLLAVKLYLMHTVWSSDWGKFEDFEMWAEGGAKAIDSEGFRNAANFFAYGKEEPQ